MPNYRFDCYGTPCDVFEEDEHLLLVMRERHSKRYDLEACEVVLFDDGFVMFREWSGATSGYVETLKKLPYVLASIVVDEQKRMHREFCDKFGMSY